VLKFCPACGDTVETRYFAENPLSDDGLSSYCYDHHTDLLNTWRETNYATYRSPKRKHELKKAYGITPEEYELLLDLQLFVCAICGTKEPGGKGMFAVDHNHDTGDVRGLLCNRCNSGIGMLLEDVNLLQHAIDYLRLRNGNPISNLQLRS
jgi:hypothetical protein